MTKNFFLTVTAIVGLIAPSMLRAEQPLATNLLPTILHDSSGNEVDPASLKGKHIGLYFSAHWCPPCRAFTPSLVEFRNKNADKDFEIIFVSLDKTKGQKNKYIKEMEMPWLTIPGASSKEAESLAQQFGIRGIPALIILAPDGSLITPNGREDVMLSSERALDKWKEKNPS